MNQLRPLLATVALASALAASAMTARAQTNAYWDANGTNSSSLGGSGTWSATGTNWTTNPLGATANTGGPAGGALFATTNGGNIAWTNNSSGTYILNFGGTAGTVVNGGSFSSWGINILTNGYVFTIDGTSNNFRTLTLSNNLDLGANTVTFANGARGTNAYTFAGPSGWTGGIAATAGAWITIANTNPSNLTNFGFYIGSGGTVSSNAPINILTLANTRVMLGSQSSGGANFNSSITNNSAGGSPLELTNSSSGTVNFNAVISGSNGLVLNNSSTGKIALNAANTYSGGTTLLSASTGEITYSNSSSFGTGAITSSGSGATNYIRASVNNADLTNPITIDANNTLRVGATSTSFRAVYSGVLSGAGSVFYSYSGFMALMGTNSSFGGGFVLGSSGRADLSKIGMAGQNSSIGTNAVITAGSITTPSSKPTIRWVGTNDDTSDKVINIGNASGGLQLETVGDGDLTLNGNINSTGLGGPKTIFLNPYTNTSMVVSGVTNITTNTLSLNGVINDGTPGYVVNDTSISTTTIITNVVDGVTNRVTNAGVISITLASVAGLTNNAPISGGSCIAPGTTITAVDTTNKVITLSQATTNTNSISAGLAVMNVTGASAATSLFIQPKSSAGLSYVNVVLGNASNSFSGPVVFTNSQSGLVSLLKVVKVGNPGQNSSLGTATNISLGGASGSTCTLDYTGTGEVSSKTLTFGGSAGTVGLSQSGSGHLKLTGNILPGTTTGARTLNLSGSTSGTGEVASDLTDPNGFALSLTKSGTGTWTLSGSNSYSGLTTVREGVLLVDGSLPTNSVTVTNNATLGGLGSIQGNITVRNNGILRPGSGATNGLLTARGTLTVDSGGSVNLTIDNLADYGRISNSAPVINGTINVAASGIYVPVTGNTFQLFSGAVGGTPTLNLTPLSSPYVWVTNNFTSTGQISVSNTAPVLTPYQSWLTNYSLTGTNAAGTNDPDGDGFINNLEFAFNGNPTVGTPALLVVSNVGGMANFSFMATTNGVSYQPQSTTNLATGPWTNSPVSVTNAADQTGITPPLAGYVRKSFATNASGNAFYRVVATITNQ